MESPADGRVAFFSLFSSMCPVFHTRVRCSSRPSCCSTAVRGLHTRRVCFFPLRVDPFVHSEWQSVLFCVSGVWVLLQTHFYLIQLQLRMLGEDTAAAGSARFEIGRRGVAMVEKRGERGESAVACAAPNAPIGRCDFLGSPRFFPGRAGELFQVVFDDGLCRLSASQPRPGLGRHVLTVYFFYGTAVVVF